MKSKDNEKIINRRKFLTIGGTAAAGIFILNKYSWAKDTFLLPKPKSSILSEAEFFGLSKFLMQDASLDQTFSKKIYSFLKPHKSEMSDLYTLYEYIRTQTSINSTLLKSYLLKNSKSLNIYSHIVTAWYTGALTIGKSSMRFSYFDAYMFKPISGIAPIPGVCGGATNYWSQKPETV